jgi:hypothetical protein
MAEARDSGNLFRGSRQDHDTGKLLLKGVGLEGIGVLFSIRGANPICADDLSEF